MTGGSSLMITLPKEWTESAGIKKNDTLSLYPQPDGSLVVSPPSGKSRTRTEKIIDGDGMNDMDLLYRMLVGAYMSGYHTFTVTSSHRIPEKVRETVEMMTQAAIGVEIVEECDNKMILKDLVDPSEMRMDRTAERMRSLVSNMLTDVTDALKCGDRDAMDNIISRDNDVDRLEWLVARRTNMAHRDPAVCRKIGMNQNEMMSYYIICRIIERIGDHTVTIAKNAKMLTDTAPSAGIKNEISIIGDRVNAVFGSSVNAWKDRNITDANGCIRECEEIVIACGNINRRAMPEIFDSAFPACLIAGSLRRISEYSMDIAEHAINTSV
jgi:phosphate uptake regulator